MKILEISNFLTRSQINEIFKLKKAKLINDDVIKPNIEAINKKIGYRNHPMYLAYLCEYAVSIAPAGKKKETKELFMKEKLRLKIAAKCYLITGGTERKLGGPMIHPGDPIYTIVTYVYKDRMKRRIKVIIKDHDSIIDISRDVANLLGLRWHESGAVVIKGCGMDMCHFLVTLISTALFDDSQKLKKVEL